LPGKSEPKAAAGKASQEAEVVLITQIMCLLFIHTAQTNKNSSCKISKSTYSQGLLKCPHHMKAEVFAYSLLRDSDEQQSTSQQQ